MRHRYHKNKSLRNHLESLRGQKLSMRKTNGNGTLPKFVAASLFRRVDCNTCKQAAVMPETDLVICRTAAELLQRAITEHGEIKIKTGILCTDPQLIVYYDTVFVQTSLLVDAGDESILTGKGGL